MLAACLCFRNAAPYLGEWLLFHCAVGFQRFHLYNNDSSDDFSAVLAPFLAARQPGQLDIEVRDWPGYFQQNAMYDDCLRRTPADTDWIAFIDDDEFLYPAANTPLDTLLREYEPFAGVAVNWQIYGSSRQIYREKGWVIRRFTWRASGADAHVKCIVRPRRIEKCINGGHQFEPRDGYVIVDENKQPIASSRAASPSAGRLRINHYLVKSIQELVVRRTARDIGWGDRQKLTLEEWIAFDRGWNSVEDTSAQRFIPRMKELARDMGLA